MLRNVTPRIEMGYYESYRTAISPTHTLGGLLIIRQPRKLDDRAATFKLAKPRRRIP